MCDASRGVVNKTNAASECAGAVRSFFQSASPQGRTAVSRTVLTERTVRAVSDQVLLESRTGVRVTCGDGMWHLLFFISPRKAGSVGVFAHEKSHVSA